MITSIPMNVCAKPEPGIEMKGQLKPVAIAFASIVLPVPGAPRNSEPALSLAAGCLELLPRLPERHDPANFLLRFLLAADVVELDAPIRVAGLEAADLRDPHQQHRAHEDQEVEDEEERQDEAVAREASERTL